MLNVIDFIKFGTPRAVKAEQDFIELPSHEARKLNDVGRGNHIYLTLSFPRADRYEVVRYDHGQDWAPQGGLVKIPVTRGVLGKRMSFPQSTCITVDWNTVQLREFIQQVK